jgi:hypothetical protein
VRGGLETGARLAALGALLLLGACARTERDMSERADLPDTMPVVRAMHDGTARDQLLDTMPGGEMARGDSGASMRLLKKKM